MPKQKKERINMVIGGLLIAAAVFVDLSQFLLGFIYLGWAVTIIAAPSFALALYLLGVPLISFKGVEKKAIRRAALFFITTLIEVMPWGMLSFLALGWTAFMLGTVLMVRWEDNVERATSGRKRLVRATAIGRRLRGRRRANRGRVRAGEKEAFDETLAAQQRADERRERRKERKTQGLVFPPIPQEA